VWINLRSYQDRGPADSQVVHLDLREIERAGPFTETYTTPGESRRSVEWKVRSLELHLTHQQTAELAAALTANRNRPPSEQDYGALRVSTRASHFAVSLPSPGVIRIAWRGQSNWVVPSLQKVLDELSRHVRLAEPAEAVHADWKDLNESEIDQRVLDLVRSGDRVDAAQLLMRRRGLSATEAHRLIEGLSERA
jgi:hypothetical protein